MENRLFKFADIFALTLVLFGFNVAAWAVCTPSITVGVALFWRIILCGLFIAGAIYTLYKLYKRIIKF